MVMKDSCLDGKCTPVNHGTPACHIVDEIRASRYWRRLQFGTAGEEPMVFELVCLAGDYRKRLTCLEMLRSAMDLYGFFETQ